MASVMAVISKAVFDKTAKAANIGDVLAIDRYTSTHASLEPLAEPGARLFLVTVRPPKEALWLVAVVGELAKRGGAWVGTSNTTPIRDISALKSKLRFASGTGIKAKPGTLGMSLQTPRALTDADTALLVGGAAKPQAAKPMKLAFKNRRHHTVKTLAKLDKVHQKQFLEAIQLYIGERYKTVTAAIAGVAEQEGYEPDEFWIDQWDVVDRKTPKYDYWVLGAGDGTVFHHGKADSPGIGSTQHSFEAFEGDDDALVEALQAAADKAL